MIFQPTCRIMCLMLYCELLRFHRNIILLTTEFHHLCAYFIKIHVVVLYMCRQTNKYVSRNIL